MEPTRLSEPCQVNEAVLQTGGSVLLADGRAYQILEKLGSGGEGTTWKATDKSGSPLAIKVGTTPSLFHRFVKQYHLLNQRRTHYEALRPCTIDYIRCERWTIPGDRYAAPVLMARFAEGVTLEARLRESGRTRESTLALFARIVRAVGELHKAGIVHGDLKPQNILVKGSNSDALVMLIDFGCCADAAMATSYSVALSDRPLTAKYYSAALDPLPTCQSDVRALGILLAEMLTGSHPSETEAWVEVRGEKAAVHPSLYALDCNLDPAKEVVLQRRSIKSGVTLPLGLPPAGLERFYLRCIHDNPEHRFERADHASSALDALLSGTADSASLTIPPVSERRRPSLLEMAARTPLQHEQRYAAWLLQRLSSAAVNVEMLLREVEENGQSDIEDLSIDELRVAAALEGGSSELKRVLGNRLMLVALADDDKVEGLHWLQRAAEEGDVAAMNTLGRYLAQRPKGESEQQVGMKWLERAGEQGDIFSLEYLSQAHKYGWFGNVDFHASLHYVRAACNAGSALGYHMLADAYKNGKGVEQDTEEYLKLLELGCQAGGVAAYSAMARDHFEQASRKTDWAPHCARAAKILRRGVKHLTRMNLDSTLLLHNLSMLFDFVAQYKDVSVERRSRLNRRAIAFLELATEVDPARYGLLLAERLAEEAGYAGELCSYRDRLRCSAAAGNPRAMAALGHALAIGLGGAVNVEEAFQWAHRSLLLRCADACLVLSECAKLRRINPNEFEAMMWLECGTKAGSMECLLARACILRKCSIDDTSSTALAANLLQQGLFCEIAEDILLPFSRITTGVYTLADMNIRIIDRTDIQPPLKYRYVGLDLHAGHSIKANAAYQLALMHIEGKVSPSKGWSLEDLMVQAAHGGIKPAVKWCAENKVPFEFAGSPTGQA